VLLIYPTGGNYVTESFLEIAIDGPSGSGKSSVAKGIAEALNFDYLDTGALYRAATLLVIENEIELTDVFTIIKQISKSEILISTNPLDFWITVDNKDVTNEIRTIEVSDKSSQISAIPEVRNLLIQIQRAIVGKSTRNTTGIVVEGRDIGSVILPNADFKFFLTATDEIRVARRSRELGDAAEAVKEHLKLRDLRDSSRNISPLQKLDDAIEIDTSNLSLNESIDLVLNIIATDTSEFISTEAEEEFGSFKKEIDLFKPTVAILGRPNVGKSTLVNRLIGQRSAVTEDTPGVTRDRVSYESEWNGRSFVVVDTGGWDSKATGMYEQVARQAEFAITEADLCLLVIDATVGATDDDLALIKHLRAARVPTLLIANKVDSPKDESDAAALWNLGLGEPYLISALHGRGAGDLLDKVVENLPSEPGKFESHPDARAIALLGRPNVGKSSLLNKLVGSARAVVSSTAGTTVDPIDEYVELDGSEWVFIDTAGIRKKFKQDSGHEYYAVLRSQGAIDRAEVALIVIDASEELSDQDRRIINMAEEAGRAVILCFNKWDAIDEDRRLTLEREIDKDLQQQKWIPKLNISATTGRGLNRIPETLRMVLTNWERRITTSSLNKLVADFVMQNPHPLRGGRQAKILFATQVATSPPTFALFATRPLDDGYVRFLERKLRENFDFVGTPIRIKQRIRNAK
jgi:GTP-binding protein